MARPPEPPNRSPRDFPSKGRHANRNPFAFHSITALRISANSAENTTVLAWVGALLKPSKDATCWSWLELGTPLFPRASSAPQNQSLVFVVFFAVTEAEPTSRNAQPRVAVPGKPCQNLKSGTWLAWKVRPQGRSENRGVNFCLRLRSRRARPCGLRKTLFGADLPIRLRVPWQ